MTETWQDRETARIRAEVARTVQAARDALDQLDPPAAIAHARSLRSILWRAEREGFDLMTLAPTALQASTDKKA